MLKLGDIVYIKRSGGLIKNLPREDRSKIGLIIGIHQEKGCYPQFKVQFKNESKWHLQQYLQKIQ